MGAEALPDPPTWTSKYLTPKQRKLTLRDQWLLLVRSCDMSGPVKATAMTLATYINRDGSGTARPALATLVLDTGFSRATVYRSLGELQRRRFIDSEPQGQRKPVHHHLRWPERLVLEGGVHNAFRCAHAETGSGNSAHGETDSAHAENVPSQGDTRRGSLKGTRGGRAEPDNVRALRREARSADPTTAQLARKELEALGYEVDAA